MPSHQNPPHYWVVTAINRLTRQRETIIVPMTDRSVADHLCERLKAIRPAKRFWLYPMVKPMPWREEQLHF